jgi:hypothetical protein
MSALDESKSWFTTMGVDFNADMTDKAKEIHRKIGNKNMMIGRLVTCRPWIAVSLTCKLFGVHCDNSLVFTRFPGKEKEFTQSFMLVKSALDLQWDGVTFERLTALFGKEISEKASQILTAYVETQDTSLHDKLSRESVFKCASIFAAVSVSSTVSAISPISVDHLCINVFFSRSPQSTKPKRSWLHCLSVI